MQTFTTLKDVIKEAASYGISATATDYIPNNYRYLRITDINEQGNLSNLDIKSLNEPNAEKYLLQENDLVIARSGSIGRNYLYDSEDGPLVFAGYLIKFPLDTDKINPYYLKYFLQTSFYESWIKNFNTGSTRGNINRESLYKLPILVLERETQDKIAETLTIIDKKVKVNSQINDNLPLTRRDYGRVG